MENKKIIKILPVHCKLARTMMNITQQELALKVQCAKKTITDFEKENRIPHNRILKEIKAIFEEAGIVLINNGQVGVKMDSSKIK